MQLARVWRVVVGIAVGGFVRVCCREVGAVGLRLAVYLGIFVLLGIFAVELLPTAQSLALAPASDKPQWIAVERPHAAFALADMPHSVYRAMRDPSGGRKDIITTEGNGRTALIEVYRPGATFVVGALDTEIAGRAAEIGRVEGLEAASAIETRFGEVALADFTLVDGERRRGCLGFMRLVQDPALQISGWVCQAGPGMVARTSVACALDKLTLLSAGSDPKLAKVFAQAELKGAYCLEKRSKTLVRRPSDWIDARQAAKLRGTAR
jgi:hypothetical protein